MYKGKGEGDGIDLNEKPNMTKDHFHLYLHKSRYLLTLAINMFASNSWLHAPPRAFLPTLGAIAFLMRSISVSSAYAAVAKAARENTENFMLMMISNPVVYDWVLRLPSRQIMRR